MGMYPTVVVTRRSFEPHPNAASYRSVVGLNVMRYRVVRSFFQNKRIKPSTFMFTVNGFRGFPRSSVTADSEAAGIAQSV